MRAGDSLIDVLTARLDRHTPALVHLAEPLAAATAHDVPVLLTGETGTGKTMLARLIHEHSARGRHPLTVVPCSALSSTLLASEFFGHAKGAFSGAARARVGRFAAAGEGTLLLEEVDTLPLDRQASLLRVVETGEFEQVGSNDTRVCRARILATSNWHLEDSVEKGRFRRDLYYRLNTLSVHLPPLRERPRDIAPLACLFAARFGSKYGKSIWIPAGTLRALQAFSWPGNIRQLENVVHQAVLVCDGPEVLVEHLPAPLSAAARSRETREDRATGGPRAAQRKPANNDGVGDCPSRHGRLPLLVDRGAAQ